MCEWLENRDLIVSKLTFKGQNIAKNTPLRFAKLVRLNY
jgi:hypothetical protein